MSKITDFMKSDTGAVIVSVILGLGLAALFRKACNDNNCIVIQGPPLKETENKVFRFDDKCYNYKASATSCDNKKMNDNE
jgi:hypothetical protein